MTNRYVRTGVFLAPFHSLRENPTLALERDMDLLVHLDKLNYHEAWIGEHHSGAFEIIASPELFIAAAAERTRSIRLGTGVISIPYHNPFIVADRMVQLDHMTRGRAMFGVGPGALVYDAVKLGIQPEKQREMLEEGLDVIIELLQGKSVTRKTDWFDLHGAQLQLPCYTQPMIEMAVASARSPTGSYNAGRHNIGMLALGGTSEGAMEAHRTNWNRYEELVRKGGGVPDRSKWRVITFAHVAETREQAEKEVAFGLQDYADYFSDVATFPIIPEGVTDPIKYLREEKLACIGTPDDCIKHFETIWEGTQGGCGAIMTLANNWADWQATMKSYELMARFVHPKFQSSNELREHSYAVSAEQHATAGQRSRAAVDAAIAKHGAKRTGL
ncbi:MAG TPA: LLM class flavin-dependent oxidoreductase [Hyphomicrobiaceae bacterium]|nr:LLM class flavin-dependent oxidoreductase [Hyphomicrobiaceae bacterium]